MTNEQLRQYKRMIDHLKGLLDKAFAAAERVHACQDDFERGLLKEFAKQAADINEGGDLRMWLVAVLSEEEPG
jgi:hypothetical protein